MGTPPHQHPDSFACFDETGESIYYGTVLPTPETEEGVGSAALWRVD